MWDHWVDRRDIRRDDFEDQGSGKEVLQIQITAHNYTADMVMTEKASGCRCCSYYQQRENGHRSDSETQRKTFLFLLKEQALMRD